MVTFNDFSQLTLVVVVLVNLTLTLRMVRKLKSADERFLELQELQNKPELAIDSRAPTFTARDLQGKVFTNTNFDRTKVLLVFTAHDCPHCYEMAPHLVALRRAALTVDNVYLYCVTISNAKETQLWKAQVSRQYGVEFDVPILLGTDHATGMFYEFDPQGAIPYFVYVSEAGSIEARGHVGSIEWDKTIAPFDT